MDTKSESQILHYGLTFVGKISPNEFFCSSKCAGCANTQLLAYISSTNTYIHIAKSIRSSAYTRI